MLAIIVAVLQQKPCAYPICAAHGLVLNSTDIASYSSSQCIQNLHTHKSATVSDRPAHRSLHMIVLTCVAHTKHSGPAVCHLLCIRLCLIQQSLQVYDTAHELIAIVRQCLTITVPVVFIAMCTQRSTRQSVACTQWCSKLYPSRGTNTNDRQGNVPRMLIAGRPCCRGRISQPGPA